VSNRLNLVLLVSSMGISFALLATACFANYDDILGKENSVLVILLFFMSVTANTCQITLGLIPILRDLLKIRKQIPEERLDQVFYRLQEESRSIYNDPLERPTDASPDSHSEA
jgi:hypothetical protein